MKTPTNTPFHDAEARVQNRFGLASMLASQYKNYIRADLPYSFSRFLESLTMLIGGATDDKGDVWAFPIFGIEGFANTLNDKQLLIEAQIAIATALNLKLSNSNKLGLLGIDLATRRRIRINGLTNAVAEGLLIDVEQSYGNCPQYIHRRDLYLDHTALFAPKQIENEIVSGLIESHRAFIRKADSFYIASRTKTFDTDPRSGIDASHRGGIPGFVQVDEDTLLFPDFSGNKFFNTIGNIEDDGRVGLFFPDFVTGDSFFITGTARVVWDDNAAKVYPGAERFIEVNCHRSVFVPDYMPCRATEKQTSPSFNGNEKWKLKAPERTVVVFAKSEKTAVWQNGTLLELAQKQGINPCAGCPEKDCGSCLIKLEYGQVQHMSESSWSIKNNQALLCCAIPKGNQAIVLDI